MNGDIISNSPAMRVLARQIAAAARCNLTTLITRSHEYSRGTRTYDNPASGAYGTGGLWTTQTAGTSRTTVTLNSYDAAGRPLSIGQQFLTGGTSFTVQRTYDLAGHVKSQTYPSGRVVNYNFDVAGRLADDPHKPEPISRIQGHTGRWHDAHVRLDFRHERL